MKRKICMAEVVSQDPSEAFVRMRFAGEPYVVDANGLFDLTQTLTHEIPRCVGQVWSPHTWLPVDCTDPQMMHVLAVGDGDGFQIAPGPTPTWPCPGYGPGANNGTTDPWGPQALAADTVWAATTPGTYGGPTTANTMPVVVAGPVLAASELIFNSSYAAPPVDSLGHPTGPATVAAQNYITCYDVNQQQVMWRTLGTLGNISAIDVDAQILYTTYSGGSDPTVPIVAYSLVDGSQLWIANWANLYAGTGYVYAGIQGMAVDAGNKQLLVYSAFSPNVTAYSTDTSSPTTLGTAKWTASATGALAPGTSGGVAYSFKLINGLSVAAYATGGTTPSFGFVGIDGAGALAYQSSFAVAGQVPGLITTPYVGFMPAFGGVVFDCYINLPHGGDQQYWRCVVNPADGTLTSSTLIGDYGSSTEIWTPLPDNIAAASADGTLLTCWVLTRPATGGGVYRMTDGTPSYDPSAVTLTWTVYSAPDTVAFTFSTIMDNYSWWGLQVWACFCGATPYALWWGTSGVIATESLMPTTTHGSELKAMQLATGQSISVPFTPATPSSGTPVSAVPAISQMVVGGGALYVTMPSAVIDPTLPQPSAGNYLFRIL